MRAEVGLLTRNIVFQGEIDPSESEDYGAHIMIYSTGDDSSITRIEGVELRDVGQAFKVGRNPINFHQLGNVHKSYVKNNSIWKSYNRAVTVSGTNYLNI